MRTMLERLYGVHEHPHRIFLVTEEHLRDPALACARYLSPESDDDYFVGQVLGLTTSLFDLADVQGAGFVALAAGDDLRFVTIVLSDYPEETGVKPELFKAVAKRHSEFFQSLRHTELIPQYRFCSTQGLAVPDELPTLERRWEQQPNAAVLAVAAFSR